MPEAVDSASLSIACACGRLRRATRALTQLYDDAMAPAGLRVTQFSLLRTLARLGSLRITALAEATLLDRTALSRNLDPLVARRLGRDRSGARRPDARGRPDAPGHRGDPCCGTALEACAGAGVEDAGAEAARLADRDTRRARIAAPRPGGSVHPRAEEMRHAPLELTPPDRLAVEAAALVAEGGFTALKLRLGRERLSDDLAAITAVREAAGAEVKLMCDFNQGMSLGDALVRCHALDDRGLYWFEEPISYDNIPGYAQLARELKTPIQLGENFYGPRLLYQAVLAGAGDYVMPDLMRIGGVSGWLRAAAIASAAGIPMSTHLYPEFAAHLMRADPPLTTPEMPMTRSPAPTGARPPSLSSRAASSSCCRWGSATDSASSFSR